MASADTCDDASANTSTHADSDASSHVSVDGASARAFRPPVGAGFAGSIGRVVLACGCPEARDSVSRSISHAVAVVCRGNGTDVDVAACDVLAIRI